MNFSDHLGNVRAVVSGSKTSSAATIVSLTDYYPFGMEMPGRKFTAEKYRYGFNGKEKDEEFEGNYDYGFRMYDSKIGKFFSTDPLEREYPHLTTYQFASNTPIIAIDLDGLEGVKYQELMPNSKIRHVIEADVYVVVVKTWKNKIHGEIPKEVKQNRLRSNFSESDVKLVEEYLSSQLNNGYKNSKGEEVYFKLNVKPFEVESGQVTSMKDLQDFADSEAEETAERILDIFDPGRDIGFRKVKPNFILNSYPDEADAHGTTTTIITKIRDQDKNTSSTYLHEFVHFLLNRGKEAEHALKGAMDNPPGSLTTTNIDEILKDTPKQAKPTSRDHNP